MIKNIILLFLFLLGIFVCQKSYGLAIIYYFSIILFFNKNYNVFENFRVETCNYNIPVYVVDNKPIIIKIDEYQLCRPNLPGEDSMEDLTEDERNNLDYVSYEESSLIISGDSSTNTIHFSHPLPQIKRIYKNEKLQFSGSPIDRNIIYTVAENVTGNSIILKEKIPNFEMNSGNFIILFPSITENVRSIIYDKNFMEENINSIDKANESDEILISTIEKARNKINKYHKEIVSLREQIRNNQQQIFENKTSIDQNLNIINNRSDYINFLKFSVDKGLQLDNNYSKEFSEKYNNLYIQNNDFDKKNDRLNLTNLENQKRIGHLNNLICKQESILKRVISKFPKHNLIKTINNEFIDTQNKSFYKFVNACSVPDPRFNDRQKKKCLPKKIS